MVSSSSTTFFGGVSAAVFAPFVMVLGFMIWDDHWTKKNGSAFSLNMFKCNLTALWFLIMIIAINITKEGEGEGEEGLTSSSTSSIGSMLSAINPFQNEDVKFLFASSTVGILIGDLTWIEGLKYLGARKVIVMDSLKPFLAAFVGWIFFDEKFNNPVTASIGLLFTVVGVTLVGFEVEYEKEHEHEHGHEHEHEHEHDVIMNTNNGNSIDKTVTIINATNDQGREAKTTKTSSYGVFMSISNVVLHTLGATLTKKYGAEMTTWEINFVRFGFSGLCMLLLTLLLRMRDRLSWESCQSWQFQSYTSIKVLTTATHHCGSIPTTTNLTPSAPSEMELTEYGDEPSPSISPSSSFVHQEAHWYALPNLSRASWIRVTIGVAFVSFIHPALTNYAMFQIPLALLLTLESIGPLYSLPLALAMHNEYPSFRASIGAVFAVAGIVLLSLQGRPN